VPVSISAPGGGGVSHPKSVCTSHITICSIKVRLDDRTGVRKIPQKLVCKNSTQALGHPI